MSDDRRQTDAITRPSSGLLKLELISGDPSVLLVQGEVDICSTDELRRALDEALSAEHAVVVDMAGVTFIDAAGLRAVLEAAESLNGVGPLRLVNASRVEWLLEMVGLRHVPSIEICDVG